MHAFNAPTRNSALLLFSTLLLVAASGVQLSHAQTDAPGNQAPQESKQSDTKPTTLELGIGVGIASRDFAFQRPLPQRDTMQIRSFHIFPNRFLRFRGQAHPFPNLSGFGINGYYDLYLGQTKSISGEMTSVLSTANTWQANLRYRHLFEDLEIAAEVGISRQFHQFTEGDMKLLSQLPSVNYMAQRVAVQASHSLTDSLVLTLSLSRLGLIEVGPFAEQMLNAKGSDNSTLFSTISVRGSGAKLGFQYQLKPDLRVSLSYAKTRYSHEYTLSQSFETITATDDFQQLVLSLLVVR